MNKSDLIKYVSDKTRVTEKDAKVIIDFFIKGIKNGLEKKERVTIHNFGSFYLQKRKERTALNPRNGKVINVQAKTVVKFKSSNKVYKIVNGGK